jgi:hypothetical protein
VTQTTHRPNRCIGWVTALALILASCAPANQQVITNSAREEARAQFFRVGVVQTLEDPGSELSSIYRGTGSTAAKGAASGAARGGLEALRGLSQSSCSGMGCGLVILLVPVFMVAGAVIGGTVGAIKGLPESEAKRIEGEIAAAITSQPLQKNLQSKVVELSKQLTRHDVDGVPSANVPVHGDVPNYANFSDRFDTILEVGVTRVALVGKEIDADFRLAVQARARAIRTSDNTDFFPAQDLVHTSSKDRLDPWLANDKQAIKRELSRAIDGLALQIVEKTFLEFRSDYTR